MDKKIMAIVNPASAGGKTAELWPKKSRVFKREFKYFKEVYTETAGEAVEIARKAVSLNYDYLMAVGGDGTVNEIVNGMLAADLADNLKTKLIISAHGTGSDLSRVLSLPKKTEALIKRIKKNQSREVNLVKSSYLNHQGEKISRYFINIADCGMGAEVAKKLNASKKTIDGSLSYLFKLFQTLFSYQNKFVRVEADQNLIYEGLLNSVVIANGNYFGGGINIAPEADLFSEKINLVLLKDFSKTAIIYNLIKAYQGKHLSHPLVESHFVKEIKVSSDREVQLEMDGETVGTVDAEFKISAKKISLLI
ncbi:YegS/Rv2252/BmrU family lipid kinase [Halanaerobium saccharolyticum]|uniref:YegS/Rv2252/BmrU family lipid kinase n=1 Tax=Halanaerobium saccharolyticum TaxID=43595 RepID=A0A4R6SEB0_9FIRM|nr:diacylglycerol kinase family protein [Halanaerobium saccharolyticum]TDQ00033.1 YegS/Rv2252/BmrU family lipid kinase [Halanaerobium saccharolyticum]